MFDNLPRRTIFDMTAPLFSEELIHITTLKITSYLYSSFVLYLGWMCVYVCKYMKSFIAKRLNSILVNLRYLRFKLLKYKENNKKMCNTFDHNFKNIPLYIMRKVSLERYYFVLYDSALT